MEGILKSRTSEKIREYLPYAYLIIGLLALRWLLVEPYVVPTGSMEPTLKTGDRLYALKCAYNIRVPFTNWILIPTGKVKRGDVVLFSAPKDPAITYVKRAVGLPGDRLEFRSGVLYINGQEMVKEELTNRELMYDIERQEDKGLFLENLTGKKHYLILDSIFAPHRDFPETTIPPGYLFAVGDNRDNSHDSRAWGFVPIDNLVGQAMFIWFSSWEWRVRPERVGTLLQ